jgi:hypothetical protein
MDQNAVDRLNDGVADDFKEGRDSIIDSYFKFAVGMAAVVAMIVYPVIFQFYGVGTKDGNINWFPPASMVAVGMCALLLYAGLQRFKHDRKKMDELKNKSTNRLQMIAAAVSKLGGDSVFEVDESGKTPRIIRRERTLTGNLLD